MTEQTMNPYAAPMADVAPTADTDDGFGPFPRFSAWWVFLLTIVTYFIYPWWWLFSRTRIINENYPDKSISNGLVWGALTVFVLQFFASLAINFSAVESPEAIMPIIMLNLVLTVAYIVFWLMWIFGVRNRINRISGAQPGDLLWAGGIMTFFFHVIYLAYKINQIKDTE